MIVNYNAFDYLSRNYGLELFYFNESNPRDAQERLGEEEFLEELNITEERAEELSDDLDEPGVDFLSLDLGLRGEKDFFVVMEENLYKIRKAFDCK